MAADIYEELPDNLKPAPVVEGKTFSSEMLYSDQPFGVHQFWTNLSPTEPKMKTMMESCPEMLGTLPSSHANGDWKDLACSLNISRESITTAISGGSFNYEEHCGAALDESGVLEEQNSASTLG
jgi:hypothetical protein